MQGTGSGGEPPPWLREERRCRSGPGATTGRTHAAWPCSSACWPQGELAGLCPLGSSKRHKMHSTGSGEDGTTAGHSLSIVLGIVDGAIEGSAPLLAVYSDAAPIGVRA
jgi:hypothetical protein